MELPSWAIHVHHGPHLVKIGQGDGEYQHGGEPQNCLKPGARADPATTAPYHSGGPVSNSIHARHHWPQLRRSEACGHEATASADQPIRPLLAGHARQQRRLQKAVASHAVQQPAVPGVTERQHPGQHELGAKEPERQRLPLDEAETPEQHQNGNPEQGQGRNAALAASQQDIQGFSRSLGQHRQAPQIRSYSHGNSTAQSVAPQASSAARGRHL